MSGGYSDTFNIDLERIDHISLTVSDLFDFEPVPARYFNGQWSVQSRNNETKAESMTIVLLSLIILRHK